MKKLFSEAQCSGEYSLRVSTCQDFHKPRRTQNLTIPLTFFTTCPNKFDYNSIIDNGGLRNMPATVERLPDEAILIARYTGLVVVDDVRHVFERSAELITPEDKIVFRITDMVHSDSDFREVLKMARELGSSVPGST